MCGHYPVRPVTRADKRARQKERSRQAREAREAALKRERRKSVAIRIGIALVIAAILIGITSVLTGGDDGDDTRAPTSTTVAPASLPEGCTDAAPAENPNRPTSFPAAPPMSIDTAKTYTAALTTSCGDITITLDTANAPNEREQLRLLGASGLLRRPAVAARRRRVRDPDRQPRQHARRRSRVLLTGRAAARRGLHERVGGVGESRSGGARARRVRSSSSSPATAGAARPTTDISARSPPAWRTRRRSRHSRHPTAATDRRRSRCTSRRS